MAGNTRRFDYELTEARLRKLPIRASASFALICARRLALLAPNRHLLAEQAREVALGLLNPQSRGNPDAESVLRQLESSPELDRDDVAASFYALASVARSDAKAAFWAAQRGYDAADTAAQDTMEFSVFTEDVEAALLSHPLVQAELSAQARELALLEQHPEYPLLVVERAGET
jgi:hypothetical protein